MAKKGEKIPEEVLEARIRFRGIRTRKSTTVALAKIAVRAFLMSFPRHCA